MGIRASLKQINLVVEDMEAMTAFYARLGLNIPAGPAEWAPHHRSAEGADGVHLDLDSQAFAAVWDRGWPSETSGVVLGFQVSARADVDTLYEQLTAAGAKIHQPPYDAFWGARYAVVVDPDGSAVGLMSPIDPAMRSAQPPPA
ncbi:MAG: VOC family protein [Sporichthyaceae bacterium]